MRYLLRLAVFALAICTPALALAAQSVVDPSALPFNPEDVQRLVQVLLERMLSHDWIGLGAAAVIVATHFGGKLLAPRVAYFATGSGKVVLAMGTSVLLGLATLLFSTPLASITGALLLSTLTTAALNAFMGVGAYRVGQALKVGKTPEQLAEEAGAQAVLAAGVGAGASSADVAAQLEKGGS